MAHGQVAFDSEDEDFSTFSRVLLGCDLVFLLDVGLSFSTAYKDEATGSIVVSHRQIAAAYLRSWFLLDMKLENQAAMVQS